MTTVSNRYDVFDDEALEEGLEAASLALQRGQLVVIPTDTVYGIAADAFNPDAVRRLLKAKGRGPEMPPPVLVGTASTLDALAVGIPVMGRELVVRHWPGPLTLVCKQQSSLQWDLGDTRGTVAVRMPDNEIALKLLKRTGPLAVSSANLSGQPAAKNVDEAMEMLGDSVAVYLDQGDAGEGTPSTIVDVTGKDIRILRQGGVTREQIEQAAKEAGATIADDEA